MVNHSSLYQLGFFFSQPSAAVTIGQRQKSRGVDPHNKNNRTGNQTFSIFLFLLLLLDLFDDKNKRNKI